MYLQSQQSLVSNFNFSCPLSPFISASLSLILCFMQFLLSGLVGFKCFRTESLPRGLYYEYFSKYMFCNFSFTYMYYQHGCDGSNLGISVKYIAKFRM